MLLLHAIAAAGIGRIEWAQGLRDRFLPNDPSVTALEHEEHLFGSTASVVMLIDFIGSAAPAGLAAKLRRWSAELSGIEGIRTVTSFLDVPLVVWDSPSSWRVSTLGEQPEPLAAADRHPLARKNFFRRYGRGTLLLLELEDGTNTDRRRQQELISQLRHWTAAHSQDSDYRFTPAGSLPFQAAAVDAARKDVLLICPPLALLVLGISSFALGSFRNSLLVVAVAALNPLSTFALAGLLGWHISYFSLIVIPVIFAVGLLDNIHLSYGYHRLRKLGENPDSSATGSAARLLTPCLWTSITTITGFCVLLWSSLPQVRQFGALCALGTAWAFLSSFSLLPFGLAKLDRSASQKDEGREPASRTQQNWELVLARTVARLHKPGLVLPVSICALLLAVPGLFRLHINGDFPLLFAPQHPVTVELKRIEKDWGGVASVSFLLKPLESGRRVDPAWLDRLENFARLLTQRELVSSVSSPAELATLAIDDYRRSFGHGPDEEQLRDLIDGLLLPGRERPPTDRRGDALAAWIHEDASLLRVVARVRMMEPELFPALVRDLEGFRSNLADLFEAKLSGWPLAYKNMEQRLLAELIESFALAAGAIGLLLFAALRSFRLWAVAVLANLVPLTIVLGAMGWSGASFGPGLLLAPGIALGLIVDDTIHFIFALKEGLRRGLSVPDAVAQTLEHSGAALTITTVVLIAGFGTLGLSAFSGNRLLAIVMVSVSVAAWVADLLLVPVLVKSAKRFALA